MPAGIKKITLSKTAQNAVAKELKEIGTNKFTCYLCGGLKARARFYTSTDLACKTGITRICKDCCDNIVYQIGWDGEKNPPTKESVQACLEYLDKPFLSEIWEASMLEAANTVNMRHKNNVWTAYIKNIALQQYTTMRWKDSSMFQGIKSTLARQFAEELPDDTDILEAFEQNKRDAIRLLNYEPFEKEALADQPFLYTDLIGYLDASENANDDRMRLSSIVTIVKGYNHANKLDDIIALLMQDVGNIEQNIPTIKALEETKNKIINSVLALAKDNGISLKHSVNTSKGENTWTGKVRKLKDMNLREAEVNLFDVETCAGMKQVAEISNAAIMKQIRLDENDYNGMLAEQRDLLDKYQKAAEEMEEKARLLLRENLDLKASLKDKETIGV